MRLYSSFPDIMFLRKLSASEKNFATGLPTVEGGKKRLATPTPS
jgi:hypothetical protein